MRRLDDCCTRCENQGCDTVVCRGSRPEAEQPCGHAVCDACSTCDCQARKPGRAPVPWPSGLAELVARRPELAAVGVTPLVEARWSA